MGAEEAIVVLAVHARGRACAVHIADVIEVMRPLPIERMPGVPPFLLGMSMIRGFATPVIDLGMLIGSEDETAGTRFVTMLAGNRIVALRVDDVIGTLRLGTAKLSLLPPIFDGAGESVVERLGVLDGHLLALLQSARLLPNDFQMTGQEADAATDSQGGPTS